jgi:putative membrane protein
VTDFPLLNAFVYACVGVVVFALAMGFVAKLAHFDFKKHIGEDRNVAAAIVAAAIVIGIAWIVAATMH